MYAQMVCVYVGSDMNQNLEDLMLEYLLRKKLNQEISIKKPTNTVAPVPKGRPKYKQRKNFERHSWSFEDAQMVAELHKQGFSHSQIAKSMNLRKSQVSGAISAMKNNNRIDSALPKLLVQS